MTILIGRRAIFSYGHLRNKQNLKTIRLSSGAIVIMANKSRLICHSIEGILNEKNNILYKLNPLFSHKTAGSVLHLDSRVKLN